MKWPRIILFFLLTVYSAVLMWIDVQWGQDQVRGFFSDITSGAEHPLPYRAFFGINTTLSVVMLSGIALLFAVCAQCSRQRDLGRRIRIFEYSQILFFLYLAADERLLIHEKLASMVGFEDAFFILGLGLVELVLLFAVGNVARQPWKVSGWLLPAGGFFGLMVFVDACLPEQMVGRLSVEDLSKTWAIFFLLNYAWQYAMKNTSFPTPKNSDAD